MPGSATAAPAVLGLLTDLDDRGTLVGAVAARRPGPGHSAADQEDDHMLTAQGDRPLRVAIAGTGMMARVHARAALVSGAVLVGVSSSTPERARQAAAEMGAARAYPDSAGLTGDPEVDVVHIVTPNHLHAELARAALRAGKHVVCEKPLATTLADARDMQALAADAGLVATVPFVYRYYPMVREARERAQSGGLGRLAVAHGTYLQDWLLDPRGTNWRVDPRLGGASRAFADIGSHWCDLLEFVTGDRVARVSSQLETVVPERPDPASGGATFTAGADATGPPAGVRTEDVALVAFRTAGGVVGSVVVSQVAAGHKNSLALELLGTERSLSFHQEQPDRLLLGELSGTTTLERDAGRLSPAAARFARLPAGHPQGWQDCVDAFVGDTYRAVRTGRPVVGLPGFDSGVRAMAVTDAVLRSAAGGGAWTDVPAG